MTFEWVSFKKLNIAGETPVADGMPNIAMVRRTKLAD